MTLILSLLLLSNHLLALSHVYLVPQLKERCIKDMSQRLTVENVVDVLQLARLCDAPDLYLKCMKLISSHFKAIEITKALIFMQNQDPWMELEILQFIDEAKTRKKRTRRQREERNIYMELSVAMDCLEHICTEGCTSVGPYDVEPAKKRGPWMEPMDITFLDI
ncbi:BTB/POZ and TAZ domain-containing protein 1-like [Euphorbia lathyris]|uniref:BTB/POZ and TAZ domain-containing protein 1-like n=1 Tax=Euphorbia lathyris TaxID=212925 RepID=UPI0033135E93